MNTASVAQRGRPPAFKSTALDAYCELTARDGSEIAHINFVVPVLLLWNEYLRSRAPKLTPNDRALIEFTFGAVRGLLRRKEYLKKHIIESREIAGQIEAGIAA